MTNAAWYAFGTCTGAGDAQKDQQDTGRGNSNDQQDGAQCDGAVAGNDRNDDIQGDAQSEVPETSASGLASGVIIPVRNAVVGLTMLAGACYTVLRRRS